MPIRIDHSTPPPPPPAAAAQSSPATKETAEISLTSVVEMLGDHLLTTADLRNSGMVLKPLDADVFDGLAHRIIMDSGLVVSDERLQLVRDALAAGTPLHREAILALDDLWQQFGRSDAWLPILVRVAKAKLPLTKLSALAVRQLERDWPSDRQQALLYIYLDLGATPWRFSLHHLHREQGESSDSGQSGAAAQPIVIGFEAPNLGPVLVTIAVADAQTTVELWLTDNERREFVAAELPELRERLLPLVNGLLLSAKSHAMGTPNLSPSRPAARHLDIRV